MAGLNDIPPLLHDARLVDCRWDRHLKSLHLSFRCLRRNVDGTPVEDGTVDLKLGGVERIVAYYSPAGLTVKPSEFGPASRITLADLEEWPHGAAEAHLAVNSPQAEFDAAMACVREALVGGPEGRNAASPLRVHVSFEPHNHGPHGTATGLAVDCDSLESFTNGVPLDIGTWGRQFEAWWAGWREHWSAKGQAAGENPQPAVEDAFIPAGQPDPPDPSYRPPSAPPFLVPPTTVPAELLKPVEDYHTGFHQQDWLTVAAAYPHFDHSPEGRAAGLRDRFLGWDHGRWVYLRRLDAWWCEGDRACVIVRGIEHVKGDDESPARNEETVITYGLRKSGRTWVIAGWSQGWPRSGSADKLPEAQPWREGYELAE
ncbi:hypothetical protein J0H58_24725 [bacterium]|nr:hypothetical protein [bacterium]